jgi:tRNA threonylcarbamoyladenosine biosynthesis protein TsaE
VQPFTFTAENEPATCRLARALAKALQPGLVVALAGPLGAGKTRFVQATAEGLGVPADVVTSPTFVLLNEYLEGRLPVYHFDTYRLPNANEFCDLGPDEYFFGSGVCLIEWADRVASILPRQRLEITIEILNETARQFTFVAHGTETQPVVDQIAREMQPT